MWPGRAGVDLEQMIYLFGQKGRNRTPIYLLIWGGSRS